MWDGSRYESRRTEMRISALWIAVLMIFAYVDLFSSIAPTFGTISDGGWSLIRHRPGVPVLHDPLHRHPRPHDLPDAGPAATREPRREYGRAAAYPRRAPLAGQVLRGRRRGSPWDSVSEVHRLMDDNTVNVRYMVDDVDAAVAFYTTHFDFTLISSAAPAFADVIRGRLRLLLSGPGSSAGRPMPDGSPAQGPAAGTASI